MDNNRSQQEAIERIAASIDAQRHKLSFVRSTIFFWSAGIIALLLTAELIVRRTMGENYLMEALWAGICIGAILLFARARRHKTITVSDRTLINVWTIAILISVYTGTNTTMHTDLPLPATGFLTLGAAIATVFTSELFRRNNPNKSNQSGSLVGLSWAGFIGAFLAAQIFTCAVEGMEIVSYILTLAANLILFGGTGVILRYNERRPRV